MFRLGLVAALLVSIDQRQQVRGGDDLLAMARVGNQSACESIRTFKCRITTTRTPQGAKPHVTGQYWRSGDSIRIRSLIGNQYSDSVIDGMVTKSLSRRGDGAAPQEVQFTVSEAIPGQRHAWCDAWFLGLLSFPGPNGTAHTFAELLRKRHKIIGVNRRTEQGNEFIVVRLSNDVGEFAIWFDPQVNYLARKVVGIASHSSPKPSTQRRESKVIRFREVAPTIYFPEEVECRFYSNESLNYMEVVKFSDVVVNEPLPAKIFELTIPPDARVFSTIEGVTYKVDANGKPVGPRDPLATIPPLPAGRSRPTVTAEEERGIVRWILWASLAILLVALPFWFYRKWRDRRGLA